MASTYDIGDVIRIASTYTDTGSVKQDPTTVNLAIETGTGGVSEFTRTGATTGTVDSIVRASSGSFYYDWTITSSGVHEYRWSSTGTIQASGEDWFNIRRRRVTT